MHFYRVDSRNVDLISSLRAIEEYLEKFSFVYDSLEDDYSKDLLVTLLTYRMMGGKKVRLPLNNPEYWRGVRGIRDLSSKGEVISANFQNFSLCKINLTQNGYPITFYGLPESTYSIWFLQQYEGGIAKEVRASPGNVVIDAGGCWGDTSLYFSSRVGKNGRVYTFEINPHNIAIMMKNFELNPNLNQNIEIVKMALWHESGKIITFSNTGPASKADLNAINSNINSVASVSIDDFVETSRLEKVDFIKMDIEGAEPNALQGARKTIRKFKPKLAISLYHSLSDFANIPLLVKELNKEYKLYLGHFQVNAGETVLFAK
jgi:FkbM family methyltransferase